MAIASSLEQGVHGVDGAAQQQTSLMTWSTGDRAAMTTIACEAGSDRCWPALDSLHRYALRAAGIVGQGRPEPVEIGQELLDVVSFSVTLRERCAGKQSVATRDVLTGQVPTSYRMKRCRQVRFPHRGSRSGRIGSFGRQGLRPEPALQGRGKEDRTDGRCPGPARAPSIPTATA